MRIVVSYSLLMIVLFLSACSNLKYLKQGQVLYTGADVKLNPDTTAIAGQKGLQSTLEDLSRPTPNTRILGLRYKLFFYNIAGEVKSTKGFRYWLKNKLGEPPVLLNQVSTDANTKILLSYLVSKGYLQSNGEGKTVISGKKGRAQYTLHTGNKYQINNVSYPTIDSSYTITRIINENNYQSLLKTGDYYDLDVFKLESQRIDNDLKEKGYFYFSPNFILLQVDSTIGNNKVNIYMKLKPETPQVALQPYTIRNINIYPNYTLERDSTIRKIIPEKYKDFNIYDKRKTYKPQFFERLVFFSKDELYNRTDHRLSLNRLVNIGTFKFVKAEFNPIDSFRTNQLDVDFLLTSLKKTSLSFQISGNTKSNNFVGSELRVNQMNRNVFRGGEQLNLSLAGGFERQFGGQAPKVRSYSLTAEAKLLIPRLVLPFFKLHTYSAYVPKTNISLGYQILNRANYYTLNSTNAEFGYIWKGSQYDEQTLNPLSVSYIRTTNTSDSFNRMLQKVPTLKQNFENQFIIATNYTYTYTDQFDLNRKSNFLFIGTAESAGNLIGAFVKKDADGVKNLFGTSLNQYLRFELDFRHYLKVGTKGNIWANRINVGLGFPRGNSITLPYVKQFFAGGSNDIRAFRARSLGPGVYNVNTDSVQLLAEQGGDLKLLLSTELRAKLYSIIQGAVFVDAGNIWLAREDSLRVGSRYGIKNTTKDLAVGAGVGLRIDARIFVLRFDLAMPIRKPYLPTGKKWVFNDIRLGDPNWRRQNLILNIAIGYPF